MWVWCLVLCWVCFGQGGICHLTNLFVLHISKDLNTHNVLHYIGDMKMTSSLPIEIGGILNVCKLEVN